MNIYKGSKDDRSGEELGKNHKAQRAEKRTEDEPGTRGRSPSNVSETRGINETNSTLKIMYRNAEGLVGNGKGFEFKDQMVESKAVIKGRVEIKLNKDGKSRVIFPQEYTVIRKGKKDHNIPRSKDKK